MANASSANDGALTVVLVHGAFADSSGWSGVVERLQAAGITVKAVPNPLRGLTADVAYVASVLEQTPGRVLAVGHSYGGGRDHQCRGQGRQRRRAGLRHRVRPRRG